MKSVWSEIESGMIPRSREDLINDVKEKGIQAQRRLEKKGGDNITDKDLKTLCRCLKIQLDMIADASKREYLHDKEEMESKLNTWVNLVFECSKMTRVANEIDCHDPMMAIAIAGEKHTLCVYIPDESLRPTDEEWRTASNKFDIYVDKKKAFAEQRLESIRSIERKVDEEGGKKYLWDGDKAVAIN